MRVAFCASCGRMILRSFAFCPYCGSKAAEESRASFEESLAGPFERLAEAAGQGGRDVVSLRIDRLLRDLSRLETEMEAIEAYSGASK
ncbi:MAG: hypothetical protein KBC36_10125 [Spirochaetia bacterium]|nr:hypothetical protein [Spirochaetia bacterium]